VRAVFPHTALQSVVSLHFAVIPRPDGQRRERFFCR
jgi:hypothetical protein